MLATAVPARAASIVPDEYGVRASSLYGSWYTTWSQDSQANVPAVVCGGGFLNFDGGASSGVPAIEVLTATFVIPIAGDFEGREPRVGIGVYEHGPDIAALTIGTPSFDAALTTCTVTATYVGSIPAGESVQFYNVWVESPSQPTGLVSVTANATHAGGDTSSDARDADVLRSDHPNATRPTVPFPETWPPA